MKSALILFSAVCCCICSGANVAEWEETPCVLPQRAINVVNYEDSQENNEVVPNPNKPTVWYVPFYHTYELYQTCSLVSGIPVKNLTEDDIKKSCLTSAMEGPGIYVTKGFNGKKIEVVTTPGKDGGVLWKLKGEKEIRGEFWITLASENYTVAVACWANGRRSFSAASKSKTFDSATRNILTEHVTLLGFDPKNFYFYSYDGCEGVKEDKGGSASIFAKLIHTFWSFIF